MSLELRPAQLSETTVQFIRQMAFCYLPEVEMRTGRLAVVTPVEGAMRNIKQGDQCKYEIFAMTLTGI